MEKRSKYFQYGDNVSEMIRDFLGRNMIFSEGIDKWAKAVRIKKEPLPGKEIVSALAEVGAVQLKMNARNNISDELSEVWRVFYIPGRNLLEEIPIDPGKWEKTEKATGRIDFPLLDHDYPVMYRMVAWRKGGFVLEKFPETLSHVNYGSGEENSERTQEFIRVLSRTIWGKDRALFLPVPEGKKLTIVSGGGYKDQLTFVEEKKGILLKRAESDDDFAEEAERRAREYRARASESRKQASKTET